MDPVLAYVRKKQADIIAFLEELVVCETPSDAPESISRFVDLVAARLAPDGAVRRFPGTVNRVEKYGPHVQVEFDLPAPPGKKKSGQILALGHSDTVYSVGTLAKMPFRRKAGRLWGPGVLDMKSGIAFFVFAMRALRELSIPVRRKVVMQLNSDEEVGSESSRPLTEREARRSAAVLVLEPGSGLEGNAKTARKGVGDFRLSVTGKAAHSGIDFASGASAIVELARQVERIAGFTDLERGITVNPGVISGGTRANVVASFAEADIDMRVSRLKDAAALEKRFRALKPFDRRCMLSISGGLNRPPMERTPAMVELFETARSLAAELGVTLEESATGGGSDGNFTAGVGAPTLDGIGGVGEGAHAAHESILIDRIADRTALLAKLVAAL